MVKKNKNLLALQISFGAILIVGFLGFLIAIAPTDPNAAKKLSIKPSSTQPFANESQVPTNKASKQTLMNNDPIFEELIKYKYSSKNEFILKFSNEYNKKLIEYNRAIEEGNRTIEEKIKLFSNESIQKIEREKLTASINKIPPPPIFDYYSDAKENFNKRKEEYVLAHKNDFFMFATYEFYLPEKEVAIFSVKKAQIFDEYIEAFDFAKSFGMQLFRKATENEIKESEHHWSDKKDTKIYLLTSQKFENYQQFNAIDYNVGNTKRFIRWERDWLHLPRALSAQESLDKFETKLAIVVEIPIKQIDEIFSSVENIWNSKTDELINNEMKIGGEYSQNLSVRSESGGPAWYSYTREDVQKYFKSFMKRNTIWLIAKGDPFNNKLSEVHLVVSGIDKSFIKFK